MILFLTIEQRFCATCLTFQAKPANVKARKRITVGTRLPLGETRIACVLQVGIGWPETSTMEPCLFLFCRKLGKQEVLYDPKTAFFSVKVLDNQSYFFAK